MPVLQYVCPKCGKKFEELVKKYDDPVACPACGEKAARDWSGEIYSATGKPAATERNAPRGGTAEYCYCA